MYRGKVGVLAQRSLGTIADAKGGGPQCEEPKRCGREVGREQN